eukprot:TRINITY_DN1526_c0_g1_i1.p2 TRINITY_DN1526_c0_g1~~TRINITY_DN1526_c0_g1_i1.p2  ORF type:complete len:484 (-),score=83.77 TRINITY_DN1526_c0_g1_i1:163-1614(-)
MNAKDFWSWFEILAGLSAGFTGIMWMYELAVFMRQRRNFTTDGTFLGFMVASLCQYAARYMFYMLGIMSLYFFTNYKGQAELNVLLPFSRDLMKFENMLITAFVCQTVAILHLMKFQTSADFFIIDWEKPRSRLFDKEQKQGRVAPVPVWRSLFVANELNEVLNESRYSLETTLFGLLFFLEVLQLNYLGVERPGDDLTPDETHPILRYACAAIFWSVVMIMQYLYVGVIKRKLSGDPFDSFLDFMSVCNISLMILDNGHHGYYLHGRSVHNFADTDNQELDEMMKRERENLCGQRGLIPNTELQSFEIFITPQLRQKYDEALKFTVKSAAPTTARQPDRGKDKSFDTAHVEPRFKACKAMNIFLTRFVDQSLEMGEEYKYEVRDKTFVETYFPFAPNMDELKVNRFYRDPLNNWSRSFWAGIEFDTFLFNFFMYTFVDHYQDNPILSAMVTYFAYTVLAERRSSWSQNNLSRKTFVDNRFLL